MNRVSDQTEESERAVVWDMYQCINHHHLFFFFFQFGKTELDRHSAGIQAEFMETRLEMMTTDLVVAEGSSGLVCIVESDLQVGPVIFNRSVSDLCKVLLFPFIQNLPDIHSYRYIHCTHTFSKPSH